MQRFLWLLFLLHTVQYGGVAGSSAHKLDAYATGTSSDTVLVMWKKPTTNKVKHYIVNISGPSVHAQQLVKLGKKFCTFSGLPPFTNFTVLVQFIFRNDSSPPAIAEASATTWPAVGQKVENLRLTASEPRSILMNWEPPTSPQGIIHSYKVLVKKKHTGTTTKHVSHKPPHTLVDLDPSTTYILSVSTRNYQLGGRGGGYGLNVSDEATTLPLDIERPTDVDAIAISSDSIWLTWGPPGYTLSNDSGYRLLIIGKNFNESVVVGKDTLMHTFSGLRPSTEYILYVNVNDSVRGVPRPMGNSTAKTWPAAGNSCGRQSHAPIEWPVVQSTRRVSNCHSWPWAVGLYTSTRGGYPYCGGTLVAPGWIVTAAHCVEMAMNCTTAPVGKLFSYKALTNATLFARIGDHDLRETEASEEDRRVRSVIVHPQYQVHSGNSEHDVALLQLEKSVAAGKEVNFVCLPRNDSDVFSFKECTFAGWGSVNRLRTLGYQNSPVLTEGRVKIESGGFCELRTNGSQHEGQACLATHTGAPCFGDSGAGVYCQDAVEKWVLFAVINRGSFLCDGQFATSTMMLPHAEWIRNVIATSETY